MHPGQYKRTARGQIRKARPKVGEIQINLIITKSSPYPFTPGKYAHL